MLFIASNLYIGKNCEDNKVIRVYEELIYAMSAQITSNERIRMLTLMVEKLKDNTITLHSGD